MSTYGPLGLPSHRSSVKSHQRTRTCLFVLFESITVCSYNSKNLKTSVTELQALCGKCDLLLLQETWIIDQEIPILAGIHKDFYSRGISSIDTSSGIHRGRPYGGLAILWRKTLGSMCSVSLMDDSRLMAIEIKIDGITMTILNVYMPYDNGNNIEEFQ